MANCRAAGFTYIGLLLFIAIGGIGLAVVGKVWHTEAQREKEKELLFVGMQYAQAIRSYYESSPGAVKQFPARLQDLLRDERFPVLRRHLRKLYRDPVTASDDWGLVLQQGRITGVYSRSRKVPLKNSGFPAGWIAPVSVESYADWRFTYIPGTQPPLVAAAAAH